MFCIRIEKDDSPQYLNILVNFDGTIIVGDDIRVVSTCKIDVHKFPFDTQECSISIGSAVYCGAFLSVLWLPHGFYELPFIYCFVFSLPAEKEMRILASSNLSRVTQFSQQIMKTQGEWEFLRLSVNNSLLTYENRSWDMLMYTVCYTHLTPGLSQ